MKCWVCNAEDGFKLCSTTLSDNRTAYRHYCPTCGNLIGAHVKKEFALACGYELTEQNGDTREYEYHRLMNKINDFMVIGLFNKGEFQLVENSNGGYWLYFNDVRFSDFIPYETAEGWRYGYYEDEESFKDSGFCELFESAITQAEFNESHDNIFYKQKVAHKIPKLLLSTYNDYMLSPKWQRQRANRMAIDNNECKLCFSKTQLHVHHITYDNFGNEPMNELITVCKPCHEKIHGHEIGDSK